MSGLRPVAELMYVDFVGIVMDQLANQAAKIRYMFGGQIGVPMVLRSQGGTGRSAAAQHSQSLEAWMAHIPGLRVAMPATVNDAYHLLRHALTLPDPVVFLEHKALYVQKGTMDPAKPDAPWGKAVVRRSGTRPHHRHLFQDGAGIARGGRAARGAGRLGRSDRPAHPQSAGRRDHRRLGAPHAPRHGGDRGASDRRLLRRAVGAHPGILLRSPGGAGRARCRRGYPDPGLPGAGARLRARMRS